MKSICVIIYCALISAITISSQAGQSAKQSSSRQEFAAASIKSAKDDIAFAFGGGCRGIDDKSSGRSALLAASGLPGVSIGAGPLGRCVWAKTSLQRLIGVAYGVEITRLDWQIVGRPRWADALQYSVEAVAPDPSKATSAELHLMLRSLLADRFKLQIHQETRNLPGYALIVTKGGSKLVPAPVNADGRGLAVRKAGDLKVSNQDMKTLARYFSDHLSKPVVDETGIAGRFNFELTWTPNEDELAGVPADVLAQWAIDPHGPSLFSAIDEQLGLRLEKRNVPTPVVVIDHVEMPIRNP